jgi:hypothetical protein
VTHRFNLHALWDTVRANWNRYDTLVYATDTVAFTLFIGNCWWESTGVAYLACLLPLTAQAAFVPFAPNVLRDSLLFGFFIGWLWPIGEGAVVNGLGWWGSYLAPGPKLWETPIYCILVGWLASSYCYYTSARTLECGYSRRAAACVAGLSALGLGIIGENLFVGARMWTYDKTSLAFWSVPAFVPIAYGLGYAILPWLRKVPLLLASLLFSTVMLAVTVGLGLAVGFFPR